jgi:hypothetical protein
MVGVGVMVAVQVGRIVFVGKNVDVGCGVDKSGVQVKRSVGAPSSLVVGEGVKVSLNCGTKSVRVMLDSIVELDLETGVAKILLRSEKLHPEISANSGTTMSSKPGLNWRNNFEGFMDSGCSFFVSKKFKVLVR